MYEKNSKSIVAQKIQLWFETMKHNKNLWI